MGLLGLSACGSSPPAADKPGLTDRVIGVIGLQRQGAEKAPAAPAAPRLALRLHAGEVLNVDPGGRSLPVLLKVFKLRDAKGFLAAPPAVFQPQSVPAALRELPFAKDVVDVRDVGLGPGQKAETQEDIGSEATVIGVVALFRAPAEGRWRFAFDTKAAMESGLTLGVHGCALSVAQGQPIDTPAELLRVAGVRCR